MKKQSKIIKSLEELIAELPDDPEKVKLNKKISVREAISCLGEKVGSKVFTKRQLKVLVEVAFPELAPVAMANLEASMGREKERLECLCSGAQNIYRFKQSK